MTVIQLPCITRLDLDPARVVANIPDDLQEVIVIGTLADGAFYFAGSMASGPDALWLLETARRALMDAGNA